MGVKIDLHVHTCYSYDATTTLRQVVNCSRKMGLDGIAITDHNTLLGALKLLGKSELLVISGIEIDTLHGQILAFNVNTIIPSGLDPFETVKRIHQAGGIAVAPHLTAIGKASLGSRREVIQSLDLDAIEVINSSAFPFFLSSYLSRRAATALNLPQTAGSDSHIPQTIGTAYTVIDAAPDVDDIIQAIKKGATVPVGKPVSWMMRLQKAALSLRVGGMRDSHSSSSSI